MNKKTDWVVFLPSQTLSEPCESIEEVREVLELNPGAGPVYRRTWTEEEIQPDHRRLDSQTGL